MQPTMGLTTGGYRKQASDCQIGSVNSSSELARRGVSPEAVSANTDSNENTEKPRGDLR
jgi:hypothetical protein